MAGSERMPEPAWRHKGTEPDPCFTLGATIGGVASVVVASVVVGGFS
jgi:hypothetical protein